MLIDIGAFRRQHCFGDTGRCQVSDTGMSLQTYHMLLSPLLPRQRHASAIIRYSSVSQSMAKIHAYMKFLHSIYSLIIDIDERKVA